MLKAAGVAAVYTPKDFELNRIMADIVRIVDDGAGEEARLSLQRTNRAKVCASAAGLTGFARNAFMPAAVAASSSLASVRPEMPMIGMFAAAPCSARIARVAARPSRPGSVTSISTRS